MTGMVQNNSQTGENHRGIVSRDAHDREREEITGKPADFVLIDAALWGDEIEVAKGFHSNFRSLFRGEAGEELDNVAPFLFSVEPQSDFANWLKYRIGKDPENRRVLWISSSATLDGLRKHFRRFLRVKKEDGGYIYFRFYDPYVIMTVFPHLTEKQQNDFLSSIESVHWQYPLSEEIETIENTATKEEEYKSDSCLPFNGGWILTKQQLDEIGREVFVRRVTMKIQKEGSCDMNAKSLFLFAKEKLRQAEQYGINKEDAVYEYILLSLRYKIMRTEVLPQDIYLILCEAEKEQLQKIDELKELLMIKRIQYE